MDDKYIINIIGTQELDGQKDTVEVTTTGEYGSKDGKKYIRYKEYDEESPKSFTNNVVKIEGSDKVTVLRYGENSTRLVLQKGVRHQCHYRTPIGDIMIGVFADKIDDALNENGGKLKVSYDLDFNSDFMSKNSFEIDVRVNGNP